jgi:hypothetical protein
LHSKTLIWRVQPGVLLVRTRLRRCIMALRRLDFPTFERPAKAISAIAGAGSCSTRVAPAAKVASWTRFGSSAGFVT